MDELIQALDVSKRTVYRELTTVEETLEAFDLSFEKQGKLYSIEGKEVDKEELVHQLQKPLAIEWSHVEKRQIALFVTIALNPSKNYTQPQLADIFEVSDATIQQDLKQLSDMISKYNIHLERAEKGQLYLTGSEVYIRLYLSQVLSNGINEFDFFQALQNQAPESIETESQYLLSLVNQSILAMVYQAFESQQPEILSKISDDILMQFILILTTSLMRLEKQKNIETNYAFDFNQMFSYMQQILSIVKEFQPRYKRVLDTTELAFFAMQLRGINVRENHSIFQNPYDMELAFNIKYLVKLVSGEFQFNFNQDNVLYHDLINHFGAALKRLDLILPEMENEVLAKLKQQYAELYAIVEEKLIEVFSPNIFSEQEIGYVVTHFASSFEKHGQQKDLNILVVCTSGIGTSKILKARLEQAIPEIEEIDVVRAVDLDEVDEDNYELIFSTILLSGFEHDYTLINPILDDQDIAAIRQRLKQHPQSGAIKAAETRSKGNQAEVFDQIKQLVAMSDTVVENFEIVRVDQSFKTINEYLEVMFAEPLALQEKLKQRLENSPLAIPETGIMLLHTTDDYLEQPELQMHDLKHPITTMGMDRQSTKVNRIVVMLGPEKMDELTTDFLGTISSSIIEKEEYTTIYQNGDTEDLRNMLKTLSVEVIKKRLK